MGHLNLLVMALALAAGMVAIAVTAQLANSRKSRFSHLLLGNILLFNMLIIFGLTYRYVAMHLGGPGLDSSGMLSAVLMIGMAALKLAWLATFFGMTLLLRGERLSRIQRGGLVVLPLTLFISYSFFHLVGVLAHQPGLVGWSGLVLEVLVMGVALVAAVSLMFRAERDSPGRSFGFIYVLLLAVMMGGLSISWFGPPWIRDYVVLVNGIQMILFNILCVTWVKHAFPDDSGVPVTNLPVTNLGEFGITAREGEIVDLIRQGMTNKEIADRLCISLATVKDHNYNIFRKTRVRNRVELTNLFRHQPPSTESQQSDPG